MDIKYTKDGKKVAVVGILNKDETIVQEIFCRDDGSEIPAGENFVVKGLLDEPIRTWKVKQTEKIEADLKQLEENFKLASKELHTAIGAARVKAQALRQFASKAAQSQLDLLEAFVSGEITHLVIFCYSKPWIRKFDRELVKCDQWGKRDLRILSLFGNTNGEMNWRVGNYSDNLGGSEEVFPVKSYEDGVLLVQAEYDRRVEIWENDPTKSPPGSAWKNEVPELRESESVLKWQSEKKKSEQTKKITELRTELEKLERLSENGL